MQNFVLSQRDNVVVDCRHKIVGKNCTCNAAGPSSVCSFAVYNRTWTRLIGNNFYAHMTRTHIFTPEFDDCLMLPISRSIRHYLVPYFQHLWHGGSSNFAYCRVILTVVRCCRRRRETSGDWLNCSHWRLKTTRRRQNLSRVRMLNALT